MKFETIINNSVLYDKCENMEELYDYYYYPLLVEFKNLQSQLEQKEKQLNEIKEFLEKTIIDSKAGSGQQYYLKMVYDFMQELERNNSNE